MQGKELFSLKNKHLTIHKSFHGVGPDGHDLFEVKGHFSGKPSSIRVLKNFMVTLTVLRFPPLSILSPKHLVLAQIV